MSANPAQPPDLPPTLPGSRLRRLVAGWRTLRKRQPQQQRYRQLVRCYTHQKCFNAKKYRDELREARLDASRVSAIGRILEDAEVTEAFLRAQNPLTYGAAVRQARENSRAKRAADNGRVIPPEGKPPDKSATEPSDATPLCGPKLSQFWHRLKKLKPPTSSWQVDCGLFELRFTPEAVADPAEPVTAHTGPDLTLPPELNDDTGLLPRQTVIPISPETAEKLDRLATRSGLNRRETAVELLRRALLAFRLELAPAADMKSTTEAGKTLQFGLQRRKNPARTIPDQFRLPVELSFADRECLAALGAGCGLSQNAAANLLLEPGARTRFNRLRAARDAAAFERQRTMAPDRFPDLGKPAENQANG